MAAPPRARPAHSDPQCSLTPVDIETHEFIIPQKEIKGVFDIAAKWQKSEAYQEMLGFILYLNEAAKRTTLNDHCHVSEATEKLVALLDTLDKWIDEIPPIDQPQRFGNKAFRTWFARLQENGEVLVKEALDEKFHKAVPELVVYLIEGVGNSTRIDYGSGHEMSFVAFLYCLFKIGALKEDDKVAAVIKMFHRYMEFVRKLQKTYRMEPAGSHGVWSLDDYQFLPFLWGSAQFLGHPKIFPSSFTDESVVNKYAGDYMFLQCIKYINSVKTGPFAEHSNQLWNISGVAHWEKVNGGLIKMYKAEVLAKFPIIQHFFFGSLLSVKPAASQQLNAT